MFITLTLLVAQTPESFTYQCVVRDALGNIIPDQPVAVQFSIIANNVSGPVEYVEIHDAVTNSFGLATVAVGKGSVVTGNISTIDWGADIYFLRVEIDVTGGTSYTDMGTVQLLSVPYALYAKNSGNGFSGDYNDLANKPMLDGDVIGDIEMNNVVKIQGRDLSSNIPANGQVLKWNNVSQTWEPSDDQLGAAGTTDGVVTGASFTGTTDKTLTLIRSNGLGDITAVFTDMVDDADADPTNELQTLSLNGSDLTIADGNTVTLPVSSYTAGTGIDIQGSQIINSAPDQEVDLSEGTGISVSGAYPYYTITNSLPDQPVALNGVGATTVSGTYPNFTISSTDNNTIYTAGFGIDIQSAQIINTSPDQEVILTGNGATSVTGTYPNFTISSTDNTATYTAGTGIDILGTDIINTSPDQPVTLTGSGATTVSGTYPNYTISSTDNNTTYTAGSGINIAGTQIVNTSPDQTISFTNGAGISVTGTYPDFTVTNSQPDQTVSLTGSGATTVTGSYPNYTISSTDNNTTYTAGTGLTLTGTQFSHNAHSGDVSGTTALTVTGIQGRIVSTNIPANGQVLKWNSTSSKWEPNDDALGAAGTNDGVVTSVAVTGTSTKTITLTRSESLGDLTATFNDDGTVYTAGTGMNIVGTTLNTVWTLNGTNIYNNNADNVGIGTATPSEKLQVNGSILIPDDISSVGSLKIGTFGSYLGRQSSDGSTVLNTGQADIILKNSGTEKLRILNNGNVGIGTNTPGNKLAINVNSTLSDGIWLHNSGSSSSGYLTNIGGGNWNPITQTNDQAIIFRGSSVNNPGCGFVIAPWRSTTSGFRMDELGNVGIGTSTPSNYEKFTVFGGNAAVINTTTGGYQLVGEGVGAAQYGIMDWDATNNLLTFGNGLYQHVAINTSGSVGVGTITPNARLEVAGTIVSNGANANLDGANISFLNNTGKLLIGGNRSGGHGETDFISNRGGGNVGGFRFVDYSNSSVENVIMTLWGDGSVGVGTTVPGQRLDVVGGNIRTNGELISTNSNQARFIYGNYGLIHRNDGSNYYILLTASGDQYGSWNTLRPFSINVSSGNVSIGSGALNVIHGGNVGITTSSPNATLSFGTGINTNKIYLYDGTGAAKYGLGIASGTLQIYCGADLSTNKIAFGKYDGTTFTEFARFQSNGYFGFGSSTPNAILAIGPTLSGSVLSTTFVTNAGALGTTSGNMLNLANIGFTSSNNTSLGIKARRTVNGTDWTTSAIGFTYDVDNTSPVGNAQIWMTSSGRVGIGTTQPTANLAIQTAIPSPNTQPLFEVKNSAGQTIFVIYEDSVRIYIDDDPAKTNKGAFAVSGRNTAKSFTNNFFWVSPDSSRVYTGDPTKGFGVKNINGTAKESYMQLTPENYFIGHQSGMKTIPGSGQYNTFVGYLSGQQNTTGDNNNFFGYMSGNRNTTGTDNLFIGNRAGEYNETGEWNMYIGNQAGYGSSGGSNNTFLGHHVGGMSYGNNNVMIGYESAVINMAGTENVFVGYRSGAARSGNTQCVYVGSKAGSNSAPNVTGNIFLGYWAGSNESGSNKLYIENSSADETSALIYGEFDNNILRFNGKVGVNTAPSYQFHVVDNTASSDNPAIYGEHAVTDNYGVGVKGVAKWKGVYGEANSASGVVCGVHGNAIGAGTGSRYGVYGIASGGASAYAGYFAGNVSVTGTLSKGGGSFKIDHPLDPENKYLYHSFVESPDMKNIYDGVVVAGSDGRATVTLPDWFDVLNMDFRYQLTPIGGYAPLYIEQKIQNNQFVIAGATPGMEVSWMVTGIRKDPFANAHRIPVEENKPPEEVGTYLYPDLYSQPVTKGLDYKNSTITK